MKTSKPKHIVCLTPVYNDWQSLYHLAEEMAQIQTKIQNYIFSIYAINDGSNEKCFFDEAFLTQHRINIINLKINVGHQRAIAIGLQYLNYELKHNKNQDTYICVLDSDGEDKPEDIIPMQLQAKDKIVFAKRVKRSENYQFKLGYSLYKLLFKILTGIKMDYGNFSVIPFYYLDHVAAQPSIWNHYAASITSSKIPVTSIATHRGQRYAGNSKMNFKNLIIHGLSAISVYFDTLCFRILKFSLFSLVFCIVGISIVLYKKYISLQAVPGWASSLILISISIIIQLFSVTFIILLFQLTRRKNIDPLNMKLYKKYIKK